MGLDSFLLHGLSTAGVMLIKYPACGGLDALKEKQVVHPTFRTLQPRLRRPF